MEKIKRNKGRAMTIPGGLAYSAAVSLTMTILLSGILAIGLEKSIISWDRSGYAVMIILFFVTVTGGFISAKRIKHQILAVCTASGIIYFAILLSITALFFGGQYGAVGETAAIITAGTGTAAVICLKKASSRHKRK